eukprot:COSAG01_NODE_43496_length_429_cov_0.906061_2_plen_44_part_01
MVVREELDRDGQQTWDQLSHIVWVKTGDSVSETSVSAGHPPVFS